MLDVRPTVCPEALGKGEGIPTCPEALTGLSGPALGSEGGFDGSRRLVSLLPSGLMARDSQLMWRRRRGLLPPDLLQKLCQVQEAPESGQGALVYHLGLLPNSPAK